MPAKKKTRKIKLTDGDIQKRDNEDARIVKLVMTKFDEYKRLRHGLEKVWEEDDEQYNNLIEEKTYQGTADIKVPATYDAVETLVSFAMDAIFSRSMPIEKVAAEGGDVEKTKLYNRKAEINMMNMPNRYNFRDRNEEAVRRGFKNGVSVVKVPYDSNTKGAAFIPIANEALYYDFLVDRPHMLDFVGHKLKRTHSSLLKERANYNKGYNITKKKLETFGPGTEDDTIKGSVYRHILTEFKIDDHKKNAKKGYVDLYEAHFMYDWDGDGKMDWAIATIINEKTLIRLHKPSYKFPPFLWWIINKQEGTLLGKSIPRLVRPHQIELNDYRSQLVDGGNAALNQMYTVDELADIEPSQLRNRQGGVVYSMQPGGINPIPRDLSFLNVAEAMESKATQDIQKTSGATPSLTDVLARKTTAYESRRAESSSTRRVATIYVRSYVGLLAAWLDLDFNYTRDHVAWEDFIRIVGKDAVQVGEEQLKDYFNVPMDTLAVGFDEVTDKVIKIQEELNTVSVLSNFRDVANLPKAIMDLMLAKGKKNVEEYVFMPPPPNTANARDENELFLTGQMVNVPHPKDIHPQHLQIHNSIDAQITESVRPMFDEHNALHQEAMQMSGGGRPIEGVPTQEMPGIATPPRPQPHGVEESEIHGQQERLEQAF